MPNTETIWTVIRKFKAFDEFHVEPFPQDQEDAYKQLARAVVDLERELTEQP